MKTLRDYLTENGFTRFDEDGYATFDDGTETGNEDLDSEIERYIETSQVSGVLVNGYIYIDSSAGWISEEFTNEFRERWGISEDK